MHSEKYLNIFNCVQHKINSKRSKKKNNINSKNMKQKKNKDERQNKNMMRKSTKITTRIQQKCIRCKSSKLESGMLDVLFSWESLSIPNIYYFLTTKKTFYYRLSILSIAYAMLHSNRATYIASISYCTFLCNYFQNI